MVADEVSKNPGPFDVRTIKSLVALMSGHGLSEIDLRQGDMRIVLRRGQPGVVAAPTTAAPVLVVPPAADTPPPRPEKPAKVLLEVKSPTPGTFYSAANPGSE